MTNGTSQGLYVIIAVVIFGIFVGISYLLFSDSLNPKLTSIFETSLNKSKEQLDGNLAVKFGTRAFINVKGLQKHSDTSYTLNNKYMNVNAENQRWFGIAVGRPSNILPNRAYIFKFDITLEEGELSNIGGRLYSSQGGDLSKLYINGQEITNIKSDTWTNGFKHNFEKNKKYTFLLEITSNDNILKEDEGQGMFFIQPLRGVMNPDNVTFYQVKIQDIQLYLK